MGIKIKEIFWTVFDFETSWEEWTLLGGDSFDLLSTLGIGE